MKKTNCPKLVKISLILAIATILLVMPFKVFAATDGTINFEGKIVRNDTGYEGLNVTAGSPACVVDGDGNDTCDFQVKYYTASSGGTLLLTETFSNVEIGQYNGAFTLSLGSDSAPTAGTYAGCEGGTCDNLEEVVNAVSSLYIELGFAPGGAGSFTETFSRMPIQASAYALKAKYASGANSAFQFDTAADDSGYSSPSAGMVYYDTTDSALKVYDGSSWSSIGSGGTGSSLFTDGGIFTYLTSLTDSFVLGSSSYTAIGVDSYSTYLSGLGSRSTFSLDMTAERLTLSGSQAQSGLTVYSDYSSTGAWPVVTMKAEYSGFDNTVLQITQDGTGNMLTLQKGSTDAFVFENPLTFYIHPRTDDPSEYTNRLYNVNGTLYWNGSALGTSTSLWTDSGTYSYLTSTTDDVIIGGNSASNAKFYFDVSTGNLGIGTSTPGAKLDIAGSSSTISNTTGDITISPDDTVVIKANDTQADNLMEWQNSTGTVLGLINQNGYAAFGTSTTAGAILTLGASTGTTAQINLASGLDVSSPVSGDLWWNGENLYFYDGSTNVDLLNSGSSTGGSTILSSYGSVATNGYLNLEHDSNTYDVVATGWLCVGGSSDESCTGGTWKDIKDSDLSVTQNLSNQWEKADTDGIIRSIIRQTDIELAPGLNVGTGADVAITGTFYATYTLDSRSGSNSITGRSCADMVNYAITSFNTGGTTATLSETPSTGCLSEGDEVLIINLQGIKSAYGNVGNYETLKIASISSNTVTFETPKTKYYGNGTSDDTNLGTAITNQRVMLQRVPQYNGFTINGTLTVSTFGDSATNGSGMGGVLFFRSTGTVTVGSSGSITVSGKGYAGGTGQSVTTAYVPSGDSLFSGTSAAAEGYGGYAGVAGAAGTYSGGGGGGKTGSSAVQSGGAGSSYVVSGGGGGGGSVARYSSSYGAYGGGGGGGGYGTYGTGGANAAGSSGASGTATSSGAGSASAYSTRNYGGGGGGGSGSSSYADTTLTKLFLGSGGGAGGTGADSNGTTFYTGGNGGNGGGIMMLSVQTLSISGSVASNGAAGNLGSTTSSGGGGGGSGGSLKILGATLSGLESASASGGLGSSTNTSVGGNGGSGRIATYYAVSTSGTSTPTNTSTSVGYYTYGVYVSPVISTTNAQSYDNLKWESTLNTYGKISVQTRSGSTSDPTDGTWEAWKPYTSGTNYTTLQSMDTYSQWTGTNATVAVGDVTRPYTAVYGFEDEYENTGTNLTKVTSSTNGGYMEATISSTNLSSYDYITLWVRASQSGNTIRIGMGESAATEQYEDITIDTANTWQKVYWDISDITSTSRDAITKLRITNFSTSSNVVYVDNIKAEKLLTTSTGSNITTTPNSYFQYRVIFTTTNTAYQPMLNNISFTYGTGYRIVMYDANNVRLYNYTSSTHYMKLSVVASTGTSTSGSGFVNGLAVSHVADGSGTVAFTFDTADTFTNSTSKLLSVMNNGVEKMYLDSDGNLYVSGTITSGAGTSIALVNNSGATIATKSLVTLDPTMDNAFTTTSIEYAQGAYGVVQGVSANGDIDADGNCDDGDTCAVVFEGLVNVYLDNASAAIKGDYVFSSTTAGEGHAISSANQENGLIGIVSSTADSGSGYVQMVFDAQNKVTANLYLDIGYDKATYRDMYLQLAEDYTNMSLAERRGVIESNQSESIMFDNLVDGLKIDSTNSSVGLDYYNQKMGLWGGLALTDSTTDIASNRYFGTSGASLVSASYYYDRTQTGEVGQDSTMASLIDTGTDPYWYKGVSYVTSCTSGCASSTNLSSDYNGALFDVSGTYASGSEHGSITVTIDSLTLTGITADIVTADSTCSVTGATLTFDQAYSFTAGSCSGSNITITPKRYLYTASDSFKIASWYIEPVTSDDRGAKQEFPERSVILTTKTSSNIYITVIDYDTQRVWMKFNSNSAVIASANILVNNADYSFTKAYMRNGNMYIDFSSVNSNVDAVVAGFSRDDAWALNGSTWYKYGSYIANRNAGSGYTVLTNPYTFSSGDGSGTSYIGLDYTVFSSSTIKGIDTNAEGTSGTYYSNAVTFQENSNKAYLWLEGYIDPSDTSGVITVSVSNDNGGNYVTGTLLHTDTSGEIPEYEYSFDFTSSSNQYKVKIVLTRGSNKKTTTYITSWGLAQMNLGDTEANGLFTNESDTVATGSYLEVVHGQNTYDLVASGWVFDTTLSKWVEVTNMDNGITQNLSNQWSTANGDGIIRSVIKQTDVELAPSMNLGTGTDGDVTFTSGTNYLDTTRFISGRSSSCPDAINYNITSFNSSTQVTLSSGPDTSCLAVGDEVLIINLQGTSSSYINLGNYETLRIQSLDAVNHTITFATSKTRYYGDSATSDTNVGTGIGNQRVVLQRVPNYHNVTVDSGVTLTVTPWDGATKGGVIFFRASGTVSIGGTVTSVGYGSGTGGATRLLGGSAGESYCYNPGGGAGGSENANGGAAVCGGGGGAGTGGTSYTGGAGTSTLGGAGGGGGSSYVVSSGSISYGGAGGGGGGAATAGTKGLNVGSATYNGVDGGTNSSGNGANSYGGGGGSSYGGGGGGGGSYNYTDTSLTKLQFGSGGGGGGGAANYGTSTTGYGGNGGVGGGIVYISADTITVSGSLSVAGANGAAGGTSAASAGGAGGGGGGGGSLKLAANNLTLGTGLVKASGGTGGGTAYASTSGGNGGNGFIAISYKLTSTITGTTTPTYNGTNVGYYTYGVYVSPVISTTNAQSYDNLKWESTLNTYGKISVQTRSGSTSDPTDGTWEAWKPYTSGTNYSTLQSMDDYTQWTGTNATVAVGDVTRPYSAVYGFEDEYENTGTNLTKVTSSTNGGYMEATISSTNLSSYDYITLWVRASQSGNTIRIGMGESAATEQYEDITIDTANTWQKVYWDISDITSTSRDAITKLRITNFSTSSNVVYVDNIKAEKLLTTSTGSNINSTPNSYFQYRVIFTTTNTAYQPMLNNISLTYSTGYKIQIVDANTVRLYNNSGTTQKMRLDIILGSAAVDLTASEYTLNIAPTTAQIDSGTNTNSIWVNKMGSGGNLLKLQTNSDDMMVVDASGNMTLAGDVQISGGSVDLGSDGASVRYNATSNKIEFTNDGTNWLALGDITKEVVLSAEYPGAVLSGDGTNNVGTMTSDNTGSSSNSMNYYEWNSSAVSLNDYDVRVRFTLPSDFSAWGNTGGIVLNLASESTSSSNNKVDMYVYKEGSVTIDETSEGNVSSSAGVWKTTSISGSDLNECAVAGDTCVFILRLSSANDNYIRIGDIAITYTRSL